MAVDKFCFCIGQWVAVCLTYSLVVHMFQAHGIVMRMVASRIKPTLV